MGLRKLLTWAAKASLGPFGQVADLAEAALTDDEPTIDQVVRGSLRRMNELHDANPPGSLAAIDDYYARGLSAVRNIIENRRRTLDWIAASEVKAFQSGNTRLAEEIRNDRQEFLDLCDQRLQEIRDRVKEETGRNL